MNMSKEILLIFLYVSYTFLEFIPGTHMVDVDNASPLDIAPMDIMLWRNQPLTLVITTFLFVSRISRLVFLVLYTVKGFWIYALIAAVSALIIPLILTKIIFPFGIRKRIMSFLSLPALPFFLYGLFYTLFTIE
jgi:hypothetical protein